MGSNEKEKNELLFDNIERGSNQILLCKRSFIPTSCNS